MRKKCFAAKNGTEGHMRILQNKKTAIVLVLMIAAQLALVGVFMAQTLPAKKTNLIDFTVVIDAGHGGVDGGVVGVDGTKESTLNLAYAKQLGRLFERAGFNVVQTRKGEGGLYGLPTEGFKLRDMKERKRIAQEAMPNLMISVHMNKFGAAYRSGPQVFFQEGKEDGKLLAESLQKVFNDFVGKERQAIAGDYFVCREISCPSVIVECGFLSNPEECAALQTEEYRKKICDLIFNGTMLYLYSG